MTEAVKPTIALLQTQAEAGGAQEIARILGNAWSAKGIHVTIASSFAAPDHTTTCQTSTSRIPNGL